MRTLLFLAASLGAMSLADTSMDPLTNAALNPITVEETPALAPLIVVKDGKPMVTVVVHDDETSRAAARELVDHVKLATGAELPCVSKDAETNGPCIYIGDTVRVGSSKISGNGLPPEGFRVQSVSNGLVIAGWGRQFAVYDVLERFLGIRWYYPGDNGRIIPELTDVTIPPIHFTDYPFRRKRHMYPFPVDGIPNCENPHELSPRYREGVTVPGMVCHSFGFLAHYFEQYPECFELSVDGQRNKLMPCVGNPKTLELALRDIEGLFERGETMPFDTCTGNRWPTNDLNAVHMQMWDADINCRCEYCKPLTDYSDKLGGASKVLGQFVANLANEVKTRWPDKKVYYMPYANYAVPPMDINFPDNVDVQIALMRGPGTQKEPAIRATHDEWIVGWYKLTGRPVQLWEYQLWPFLTMPFQYPHVLQRFQQEHRDDNVGSFINGFDAPSGLIGEHWAQQGPTLYCWYRLLWNPDFNVDAALEEYVVLMYGPAQKPMRAILKQLTDRWENILWKDGPATPDSSRVTLRQIYEETMPPEEIQTLSANLAAARELAPDDSVFQRRVDFLGRAIDRFLKEAATYKDIVVNNMSVHKAAKPPVIDGKLDDACWSAAELHGFVLAASGKPPKGKTLTRLLWDDTGLFLGFHVDEPFMSHMTLNVQPGRNNTEVWLDDSIEIFLDTGGKQASYVQFIGNALGTMFDPTVKQVGQVSDARCAGYRGTNEWSMEVYIPFKSITGSPVAKGTIWTGNFVHNRRAGPEQESQRWNTQFGDSHHDLTAFGKLIFSD